MKSTGVRLGAMATALWVGLLVACSSSPPPEPLPPMPPPRPACNGVLQMSCFPALPFGACMPAAQIGGACSGLTALSEGQLTPQGCCYSVCAGIPGQC